MNEWMNEWMNISPIFSIRIPRAYHITCHCILGRQSNVYIYLQALCFPKSYGAHLTVPVLQTRTSISETTGACSGRKDFAAEAGMLPLFFRDVLHKELDSSSNAYEEEWAHQISDVEGTLAVVNKKHQGGKLRDRRRKRATSLTCQVSSDMCREVWLWWYWAHSTGDPPEAREGKVTCLNLRS